jgi:hypothetical protein
MTSTQENEEFAGTLKRLMAERGMDDVLLAADFRRYGATVTPMTVRNWREAKHLPHARHYRVLSQIFDVPIDRLLSGESESAA